MPPLLRAWLRLFHVIPRDDMESVLRELAIDRGMTLAFERPYFGYSQLAVVAPTAQTTVHTNTGAFDVQLSVNPGLRQGDAFVLTLDGNTLPTRYASATIGLTEKDYQLAAANTHQHSIAAAVVDANGKVMISSDPVSFYVSRTTVREERHRR